MPNDIDAVSTDETKLKAPRGRREKVDFEAYCAAAAEIQAEGQQVTQSRVLKKIGGSYSTLGPLHDRWEDEQEDVQKADKVEVPGRIAEAGRIFVRDLWSAADNEASAGHESIKRELANVRSEMDGMKEERDEAVMEVEDRLAAMTVERDGLVDRVGIVTADRDAQVERAGKAENRCDVMAERVSSREIEAVHAREEAARSRAEAEQVKAERDQSRNDARAADDETKLVRGQAITDLSALKIEAREAAAKAHDEHETTMKSMVDQANGQFAKLKAETVAERKRADDIAAEMVDVRERLAASDAIVTTLREEIARTGKPIEETEDKAITTPPKRSRKPRERDLEE